jgi:copper chaperone
MTIELKVPSIACNVCAETITKAIKNNEPNAEVKVNVEEKIVTVETTVSENEIKEIITKAGHTFHCRK